MLFRLVLREKEDTTSLSLSEGAWSFIKYIKPLSLDVEVKFHIRGGIAISAKYHWEKKHSQLGN